MKIVRLVNGKVVELLPEITYAKGIAYWYGTEFAQNCVEAPDDVKQGMVYDAGQFIPSPAVEPETEPTEPTTEEILLAALLEIQELKQKVAALEEN